MFRATIIRFDTGLRIKTFSPAVMFHLDQPSGSQSAKMCPKGAQCSVASIKVDFNLPVSSGREGVLIVRDRCSIRP